MRFRIDNRIETRLSDFLAANEFSRDERSLLLSMEVGDTVSFGGQGCLPVTRIE